MTTPAFSTTCDTFRRALPHALHWADAGLPRTGGIRVQAPAAPEVLMAAALYKRGLAFVNDTPTAIALRAAFPHCPSADPDAQRLPFPAFTLATPQSLEQILSAHPPQTTFWLDSGFAHAHGALLDRLPRERCFVFDNTGEGAKTAESLLALMDALPPDTSSLFAMGGGMLLDMAGLGAGLLGIPCDALATTFLAACDAAFGGKTAVNLWPFGKNLLGLFAPFRSLVVAPHLLLTLPVKEWLCGLGEVYKHLWLAGTWHEIQGALQTVERWAQGKNPPSEAEMVKAATTLILDSIETKCQVVARDPMEKGIRKALNLGHTLGHALEGIDIKGETLGHGLAVLLGLSALIQRGLLPTDTPEAQDFSRRLSLLLSWALPLHAPRFPPEALSPALFKTLLEGDKKNETTGLVEFALPPWGWLKKNPHTVPRHCVESHVAALWASHAGLPLVNLP